MATFAEIEQATLAFSTERRKLADIVLELESQIEDLKRKKLKLIREAVGKTAEKRSLLHSLIKSAAELFVSPRTVVIHGVKVGYNKGKGRIEYTDGNQVADRVQKLMPKEFDQLIETKYVPIADTLSRLDATTLRKLGVNIIDADDQVVIKPTDSAVDKVVNALLKDSTEEGK